jgi:hypothetical protein
MEMIVTAEIPQVVARCRVGSSPMLKLPEMLLSDYPDVLATLRGAACKALDGDVNVEAGRWVGFPRSADINIHRPPPCELAC